MEFKGTKGKWIIVNEFCDLESEKGESIASFHWNYEDYHTTMVKNEIEGKHNALLISKAPEMLELINEFYLMCIQKTFPTEHELEYMAEKAEKLIKEATEL